jgi:hypothetical protein
MPESNYTPPPPHALYIWNAQDDLYFHQKIGDSSVIHGKNWVLTAFVDQMGRLELVVWVAFLKQSALPGEAFLERKNLEKNN